MTTVNMDLLQDALTFSKDKSEKELHDYFVSKGHSMEMVGLLMQEVKKYQYLKRRKRGTQVLAVGCALLLVGFLATVLMFHRGGTFDVIMYSFSILGITFLLWGMVDFLGW